MIKQLIRGMVTLIPGVYNIFTRKRTGGTVSAKYCYSVYLRHLVMANKSSLPNDPKIIAELGPGDSIGIGLAALISGAEKYYALDVVDYATNERNLDIFDELVTLFKNKEDIPGEDEFPKVIPRLSSYAFPRDILTDDRLNAVLDSDRLSVLRQEIVNVNNEHPVIQYQVPWYDSSIIEKESVDMVLSQAVLEHIEELEFSYEKMYLWLKPGGFMSHSIDFGSHGLTNEWNGHWAYSDFMWKLIKGGRPFLINRRPYSHHVKFLEETGFNVIRDMADHWTCGIDRKKLARRFRGMLENDFITRRAFIQAIK